MYSKIIFDKKLKKDVMEVFVNNSNDIQVVDDIFLDKRFQLEEDSDCSIDIIELYSELYKQKRAAQLLLNLYNNYESYKNFEINAKNVGSKSTNSKPDRDDVIDSLYDYVFYFLIIQRDEHRKRLQEILEIVPKENYKCYMCNSRLQLNDLECSTCQEPVDLTIDKIKEHISDGVYESLTSLCEYVNIERDIYVSRGSAMTDNSQLLVERSVRTSWKCDKCALINASYNSSCVNCKNRNGEEWTCSRCTAHNTRVAKRCQVCGYDNDVIKDRHDDVIVRGLCDEWKCWYCTVRNYDAGQYCSQCGLERVTKLPTVKMVYQFKDGRKNPIWICGKCDLINVNIKSAVCEFCNVARYFMKNICNYVYDYVLIDGMDLTKVSSSISVEKWQCDKCQYLNDGEFISCTICSSDRFHLWTCSRCTMDNKMSSERCGACNYRRQHWSTNEKKKVIRDRVGTNNNSTTGWKCWYKLCRQKNYGDDKYCKHCKLEKCHNTMKGAPVWQRKNETIEQKWICDKCHKINDAKNKCCANEACRSARVMIYKWCIHCGYGNTNRFYSQKCGACRQSFFTLF